MVSLLRTKQKAHAIGGTFAKPQKPTLNPSFAKEPPSQYTTKTDTKLQQNGRQEKKGEGITSPIRKQGLGASLDRKVVILKFSSL